VQSTTNTPIFLPLVGTNRQDAFTLEKGIFILV
jgi:hypothetical protein